MRIVQITIAKEIACGCFGCLYCKTDMGAIVRSCFWATGGNATGSCQEIQARQILRDLCSTESLRSQGAESTPGSRHCYSQAVHCCCQLRRQTRLVNGRTAAASIRIATVRVGPLWGGVKMVAVFEPTVVTFAASYPVKWTVGKIDTAMMATRAP